MTTAAAFWTLGDYSRIAELIAAMGPALVSAAGVAPGQRVLDVGAGTGNATLPAAAAGAHVIGTDVAPELMAIGERAAEDQGLSVTWQVADAQDRSGLQGAARLRGDVEVLDGLRDEWIGGGAMGFHALHRGERPVTSA